MALFGRDTPDFELEQLLEPQQEALRNQLIALIGGQLGQGFTLPDFVTGPSGLQQQSFNLAGALQGGQPFQGARNQAILDTIQGRPSFTVDPATRQQFFEAQLAPAQQAFKDASRGVAERFAGIGATGDLSRALSREAGRFGDRQTAVAAGLVQSDIAAQRTAQENAANRRLAGLTAGTQESLLPINVGLQAGGVQRGISNQLQAQAGQQQLAAENPFFNPALNFLGTALQPTRFGVTQPGSPGFGGLLGTGIGALGGGLIGGPAGALLGASLGGTLGGSI